MVRNIFCLVFFQLRLFLWNTYVLKGQTGSGPCAIRVIEDHCAQHWGTCVSPASPSARPWP